MTDSACGGMTRLLMQFHITGRCNLRCKHCYRTEGDVETLSTEDVFCVIDRYKDLLSEYNRYHHLRKKGHINITGGEPFVRKDIKEILLYLGENREVFSYGILSNGSFIDDGMTDILKRTGVTFVQLSLDGNREMHDSLRAQGDYDRVLKTAQYLQKSGIRTYISFTANKDNYKYLPLAAKECRARGIAKLWSDRLVPIGNGREIEELAIDSAHMRDYIKTLKKARGGSVTRMCHPDTEVAMNRALQFLGSGGSIYSCSAGKSLITVDEFGNMMPCRRMPIICGNVLEESMTDIYFKNEKFKVLRMDSIPNECIGCKYSMYCRGGARCQSYAVYGSFLRADPACPLAKKRET